MKSVRKEVRDELWIKIERHINIQIKEKIRYQVSIHTANNRVFKRLTKNVVRKSFDKQFRDQVW